MSDLELTMMRRVGELNKEVASLKAEVERLTAFTTRTIIPNEELMAENARLREAGDELAKCITPDDLNWARKYVIMWREACKKGGQP
jgi:regulator of replication initiation timing